MEHLYNMDLIINNLSGNLISEAHLVAELYHKLRSSPCELSVSEILLEYPYTYNPTLKCDVYIKDKINTWIEIKGYFKTESPSTRSRKHTKEESSPFKDIDKMSKLGGNDYRILFIYQNVAFDPVGINSWSSIKKRCEEAGVVFQHLVVSD